MSAHPPATTRLLALLRARSRRIVAVGLPVLILAGGLVAVFAPSAEAAAGTYASGDAIKPIVSYDFDGDSGTTVVDSSGNGNNGTWVNGVAGGGVTPTYGTGVSGKAAHVSGNKNVIQMPLKAGKTDGSSSFSFEFWYFQNTTTSDAAVFADADTASCDNPGFSIYNSGASDSTLRACWGLTSGGAREYLAASTGPVNGAWHYIAAVIDRSANTVTTYEDGAKVAQSTSITASTTLEKYAFALGSEASFTDTGDGYVDGLFDDVNFYDAAIPASQIMADYQATEPRAVPTYTVDFEGNGATGGSMSPQTVTVGATSSLTANAFTDSGRGFGGWATSPTGPIVYPDGADLSTIKQAAGSTLTLYAVWDAFRAPGDTVAPVLSYDFDADSGSTVVDSSGGGLNGTWTGTPSYVSGVSGKAAYVNSPAGAKQGANYVSLPDVAGVTDGSSSFSYVFWLDEASSSSDSAIVSNQNFTHCYNPGTSLYNTAGSPGVLRACFGQNGTSTAQNYLANVSGSSVIGQWHQVAVVVDRIAGTMTTYLDGQLTAQNTNLTGGFDLVSGYPFRIGSDGSLIDTGDGFVDDSIDDFDFYDQAVSQTQIQNDYAATVPPPEVSETGSTVQKGFVSDTFRDAPVRVGGSVLQPLAGLWNGSTVTSYTKVSGDSWLSVGANGTVTGTAPATAQANPATITVQATDGTTTSQLTLEVPVIGKSATAQIAAATWNLWDAGSHVSDSLLKDLAVIASNGLDVVGVQQDGGTVAASLAHALGWYDYEGADGVGIVSAYPLSAPSTAATVSAMKTAAKATVNAAAATASTPALGVTADVLGRDVRLWSVGLDSAAYGPEKACVNGVTSPSTLVSDEQATLRYTQAKAAAAEIRPDVASADTTPVVMLADLQSPSSADWTQATASAHCGIGAVDWPVPDVFTATGLKDSFRVAHPDPTTDAGNTWSPIEATNPVSGTPEPQDRIDYVDYAGSALTVLGSNTLVAGWPTAKNVVTQAWTSDHRAVVTTFTVAAPAATGGSTSTPTPSQSASGGSSSSASAGGSGASPKESAGAATDASGTKGALAGTGSNVLLPLLIGAGVLLLGAAAFVLDLLRRRRRAMR